MYQVMKPTAKIIICDDVLKPTPNEWKGGITGDLLMSVSVNGKEMTLEEWTQLLGNGV